MNVQVRVTYHSCSGSWYVSLFLLSFVLYFRLSLFILFPFLLSCTSFSLLFRPIPRRRCTNTTLKVEVSFKHWTLLNVCFSFLLIFTFSFLIWSFLFSFFLFHFSFVLFILYFVIHEDWPMPWQDDLHYKLFNIPPLWTPRTSMESSSQKYRYFKTEFNTGSRGEVRWGEVRWGEVRWGEVRWGEVVLHVRNKWVTIWRYEPLVTPSPLSWNHGWPRTSSPLLCLPPFGSCIYNSVLIYK